MLDQVLQNKEFIGRDGFYWWIGQIPKEEVWKKNTSGVPLNDNSDVEGFGERYKVRIMGSHLDGWESKSGTEDPDITDEDLPWAVVMYPVTAGGGPGASFQSSNLTQGTFVFGFYLDGKDGQQPVIMGTFGYNDRNQVSPNSPSFTPITGFTSSGSITDGIPSYAFKTYPGGTFSDNYSSDFSINLGELYLESVNLNTYEFAAFSQLEDGKKVKPVAVPSDCKSGLSGIQLQIKEVIQKIEKAKKSVYDYRSALATNISDIQKFIDDKILEGAKLIAGGVKWVITLIEKEVIKKINDVAKKTYNLLMPNEQPAMKEAMETASDIIACVFKKIIDALLGMIISFLTGMIDKTINTAECLVNNFLGGLFAKLAGLVDGAVSQAFGAITSVVDGIAGIADGALSIAGGALKIINDVLSFLSCEENPECPTVDEWSVWDGGSGGFLGDVNGLIDKITSFTGNVTDSIDLDSFDFSFDIDELFDAASCDVGPRTCGPPTVNFHGPGQGANINLVVSEFGSIIAGDIISSGFGYDNLKSYSKVVDDCNTGSGGVIRPVFGETLPDGTPIIDPNGNPTVGIVDIIIVRPGKNYLPSPNGSEGGDGRVWKNPEDTVVRKPDGTYEPTIPPGYEVPVGPGDEVTIPPGTKTETDTGQTIVGGIPTTIENDSTFTTPPYTLVKPEQLYPSSNTGQYPVILYLCDIIIENTGINYQEGDEIVIEPNSGAIAVPKFDDFGRVVDIKITQGGEGFTDRPSVFIKSDRGVNSVLIPKFCIDRLGENDLDKLTPGLQDKVISVVDCVGKFDA
jgi:hypothetical protein